MIKRITGKHPKIAKQSNQGDINLLHSMDLKMHRDGKGANPREHSKLCDRGE